MSVEASSRLNCAVNPDYLLTDRDGAKTATAHERMLQNRHPQGTE